MQKLTNVSISWLLSSGMFALHASRAKISTQINNSLHEVDCLLQSYQLLS